MTSSPVPWGNGLLLFWEGVREETSLLFLLGCSPGPPAPAWEGVCDAG